MQYRSINNSELFIFENFINQTQKDELLEIFDKAKIIELNSKYDDRDRVILDPLQAYESNLIISDQLIYLLDFYNKKYKKLFTFTMIQKPFEFSINISEKNQGLKLHYDILKVNSFITKRLFGAVLYLTDNFEGGEIVFPFQDFVYKPKIGTLITFPSNVLYPHFVRNHIGENRIIFQGYITYS
jgi:hypothetical protein